MRTRVGSREQQIELEDKDLVAAIPREFRPIIDITEFGRAVHVEMDAILTCARSGVSPKDATLYTTTFPCHNCTRHIIAAGIKRVYYIVPYAKSRAEELHEDAIVVEERVLDKRRARAVRVRFTHFVGIGQFVPTARHKPSRNLIEQGRRYTSEPVNMRVFCT